MSPTTIYSRLQLRIDHPNRWLHPPLLDIVEKKYFLKYLLMCHPTIFQPRTKDILPTLVLNVLDIIAKTIATCGQSCSPGFHAADIVIELSGD
jgi:hypothetical protein